MTPKQNRNLNEQVGITFLLVIVLAGLAAGEIYEHRAWFHAGDHIGIAQAAAAIIFGAPTLFLAVGAVIVGVRAAKASEAQAEAAKEQATAARDQSALAKAQLKEALRPVIAIRRADFAENATFDSDLPPMQMHNVGVGTARNLTIARFERAAFHVNRIVDSLPMIHSVLPPGQVMKIPKRPDKADDMDQNLMIFYESISGDRYCSTHYDNEGGPLLNYEDDPLLWPGLHS